MLPGPSPHGMPQSGDKIAARYRVESVIGLGGMGCVLAAEHLLLRTRVAIKLLLPQAAAWPGATERFLREAQAAATLRGEHVARVIDMGTIETGAPFMVMEFLQGRDLQKIIHERAPLSVHEAVDYLLQTCDAIHEAHSLGILHRDIKPANLFVTSRPSGAPLLKVLDFGLAKVRAEVDSGAAPEASITQTGQIIGSPHYMPPEQFRGLRHADVRSDIWALGVVLYELLTGRRPFTGEGTGGVMASIFSDDPAPLTTLRPDLPPALAEVVMACLEKKADRRPQQVAALIAALEPFAPRPDRASLAWIDPPLSPADSPSCSAAVSHGVTPPPGSGTVRIGVAPADAPPSNAAPGASLGAGGLLANRGLSRTPGGSPPKSPTTTASDSTPAPVADKAPARALHPGATPPLAAPGATPALAAPGATPALAAPGATPGLAAATPALTAAVAGVSTSAYMGIATPILGSQDPSTTGLAGELAGRLPDASAPVIGPGPTRAASGSRLVWILAASVAGIVAVVGVVARAVVSGEPNAAGAPGSEVGTAALPAAPPAVSVTPASPVLPTADPSATSIAPPSIATPTNSGVAATGDPAGSPAPSLGSAPSSSGAPSSSSTGSAAPMSSSVAVVGTSSPKSAAPGSTLKGPAGTKKPSKPGARGGDPFNRYE